MGKVRRREEERKGEGKDGVKEKFKKWKRQKRTWEKEWNRGK